jgi:transposase-like protein
MLAGESVTAIAAESGISPVTVYGWKKQALIDAGGRRRRKRQS